MGKIEDSKYIDLFKKELDLKLTKVLVLRDYAIENNFDVPDETLFSLGSVQEKITVDDSKGVSADLDIIIKTLTQLLYPTNYESILIARRSYNENFNIKLFRLGLFFISILFLIAAVVSYNLMCEENVIVKKFASILSISLGVLGSMVYIMFNIIGILNESAFNAQDSYANYTRILLGAVLGWVFYFGFAQDAFHDCSTNNENYIYLLIPFLVGFSTKLVVGILNQLIKAFELMLGIDNKDVDILIRRKNKKSIKK